MKTKLIIFFLLSAMGLCNAQTVYLYTPNGSQVRAFINSEMSSSDIAYYTKECATLYPNAEILANASSTYNCHSYAWNMTEGGTVCWLNQSPDLHLYWDDGSYEVTTEANAEKIFYYNDDHSAVKSTTYAGKYESKWGSYPLVRHSPEYGPSIYNMQYRRYYRRKCLDVFANQTVTTNTTVNGCTNLNVQNVTVTNNALLKLDAPGDIVITGPFEVQAGSSLQVK